MRYLLLSCIVFLNLFAQSYYAKVEPIEIFSIKSSINAKVVSVKRELEGKYATGEVIIKLDDNIDRFDLKISKQKMDLLNTNIKLSNESLENLKRSLDIQQNYYEKIKNLKTKSQFEKDAKLLELINLKNSYIQSKINLQNLKSQKVDLSLKIKTLQDIIDKKNIKPKKGLYIYKIYPNRGDFANIGSKLMDIYDLSYAKLTIFLSDEDLIDIDKKRIFIDQKPTDYKIDKLWKVTDTQNISAYKAEIVIKKPDRFSKLVKIELK